MAIEEGDFDEAFIASAKMLMITGTHFSTPAVHRVSGAALRYARANDVRTILDIDYRPVLWGLTGKADGATRFIAADGVTRHLQSILPHFDMVVGTEEEFMIAGGGVDVLDSLRAVRRICAAVLVMKRGALGCVVITGEVPQTLEEAFADAGVQVEVMNVLGAGDAFLSGFLKGWVRNEDYEACCRYANACGALVVSRHACAPAMPSAAELDYFLRNAPRLRHPDEDRELVRLHRVSVARRRWDEVFVFAFDHRDQLLAMAREAGASADRLPHLKRLLVDAVKGTEAGLDLHGRIGILADDRFGMDALNEATGRGWWIGRPVELPGADPLEFERGPMLASHLAGWPREHIVKCLVRFHPDDAEIRAQNLRQIGVLYAAAQTSGHELLLEIIPAQGLTGREESVPCALAELYDHGIYPEWWKLGPMSRDSWDRIDALIAERDGYCRGVLMLGLDAGAEELAQGFRQARGSRSCKGFAVGRTLFRDPARRWLTGEIDDGGLVRSAQGNFVSLIEAWRRNA
jgi:5-dehydro-2-deoxygluconokinase